MILQAYNLAFKRECKINDFIHKASDLIIKHCLEYKIANIIIGKNKEWKQEINLGKKNKFKFHFYSLSKFYRET